ncbi:MAG: hypothetical protein WCZ65_05125 [Lysobacteraceae bacterium]
MSTALIAVVVALLIGHHLPVTAQWRRFEWFVRWQALWRAQLGAPGAASAGGLLLILSPVLLLALLQWQLADPLFGFPAFLLGVAALLYSWGPRDLDRDVDAVLEAEDAAGQLRAAQALFPDGRASLHGPDLIEAVFSQALRRWFGVLLWFLLLGPCGALLYRLGHLVDAPTGAAAGLRRLLDWPAAQLMTLALALAGSFDAVLAAWRNWYRDRDDDWFGGDIGFLSAAARASVVTELADAAADNAVDDDHDELIELPVDQPEPAAPSADAPLPASGLPALHDAMSLVWRILIVWLTVLAVLVLAGYIG